MARSQLALNDFLMRQCRIHPSPAKPGEEEFYVFNVEDGRHFMTESHLREILRAAVPADMLAMSKWDGEPMSAITTHYRDKPEIGVRHISIPVRMVASLSEKQAFLILRNLEGIQKDVEEGRLLKDRAESLFGDTAVISIITADNGDRLFSIAGKRSESDQRRYMEHYAEQVASKTLFDVAKALNGRLNQYVPEELRGKHFIEGHDYSDRKIRYGEEVRTELMLTDEGAWIYLNVTNKNPHVREPIAKLMQQAMSDPFGLSLSHYMGKHNVMKAGKRPLVKIPPLTAFLDWIKGLFGGRRED